MSGKLYLGIDAGGTNTDAALLRGNGPETTLLARAKVKTRHTDLTASVREALVRLGGEIGADSADIFTEIGSVTLGATLVVNALCRTKPTPLVWPFPQGRG